MSLYMDYLTERTEDKIIEISGKAFATFRYIDDAVYIIDIFVDKKHRKEGIAANLADSIAILAKAKGINKMIGTVVPNTKGSTDSLKVLIAYGMTLKASGDNYIIFEKEI